MNSIKKHKLYIPIALFFLFYIVNLIYFNIKGPWLINSDTASEMVLASLLNAEGKLITRNWFYSSEIRVLNTNIIYKIGLLFFPASYHRARLLSIALFLLILGGSVVFMMNALGRLKEGLYAAVAIIAPVGAFYSWNVIYGSFYVPHITITFFALGMFVKALKSSSKRNALLWGAGGCILAFLSGLGGVRQLMVCYLPLFAAVLAYVLIYCQEDKRRLFKLLSLVGSLVVASVLGYVVNIAYLGKHYTFYAYNEATLWTRLSLSRMLEVFGDLAGLYGWQSDIKVVGFQGITNVLSLAAFLFLFAGMIAGLWTNRKQEFSHRIIYLFTGFAFLIQLIIYGNTSVYNESYWIPFWPFLFITGFLFLGDIKVSLCKTVFRVSAVGFIMLSSVSTMMDPYVDIAPTSLEIMSTARWFNDEGADLGYIRGYASFWNANIITELTDGRVELWTTEDYNSLEIRPWLQKTEHMAPPVGRFFIVVNAHECDDEKFMYSKYADHLIFESSRIKVFGFESLEEYFGA